MSVTTSIPDPQSKADPDADIKNALVQGVVSGNYAIIVTDHQKPDEPIAYVNKAYEDLTGYKLAEIIGFHPHFLRTNDRDQVGIRALEEAIKNGTACSATLRDFKRRDPHLASSKRFPNI